MSLTQNEQISLYRKLMLCRLSEDRICKEYSSDAMKTPVHLGIGGEAIAVGVIHALPSQTRYFGTYRNHSMYLALSDDTDSFFTELYGKVPGCAGGKAGSMHLTHPEANLVLTSAVVATTIPVAVGAAFASKYLHKKDEWTAVFFGDGAVEEGAFWESLNFASLKKLPILFVCEDNTLAIHTFKSDRQGFRSLESVAASFDMPFLRGDGRHLNEVVAKTQSVFEKMKKTGGPGFVHFDYFRHLQHVGPLKDFDAKYRPEPIDMKTNQDPVYVFEQYLLAQGVKPSVMQETKDALEQKISASVERAKNAPFPEPRSLYDNVYCES